MRVQRVKLAPVTATLIILQILIYGMAVYFDGTVNSSVLLNMGARSTPLIKEGQWWRLISPVFLHVNLTHLIINSVTLLYIGRYIEEFFGHWRMIVIYFVSAVFGNLASAVFMPNNLSAGASTAIFGLFGAFVMLGICFHKNVVVRVLSRTFLFFIVINIVMDAFISGIDLVGHVGGLFGGFFMAAVVGAPILGNIDLIKRFLSGTILTVSLIILSLELRWLVMAVTSREYRTLYDVQQLLKEFNVFVYVGKRLYDIELMAIELDHLYQAGVIDKQTYMKAKIVLRKEHREEQTRIKEGKEY